MVAHKDNYTCNNTVRMQRKRAKTQNRILSMMNIIFSSGRDYHLTVKE